MHSSLVATLIAAPLLIASLPAQTAANLANYYRVKLVKTIDQHGFERNMPSASMQVPIDGQFTGRTAWVRGPCADVAPP